MRFDIMTLFPEAVSPMLNASILGRAQKKGLIEIHAHQIRDYTVNRQNQVDRLPLRRRTGRHHAVRPPVALLVCGVRRDQRAGAYGFPLPLRPGF